MAFKGIFRDISSCLKFLSYSVVFRWKALAYEDKFFGIKLINGPRYQTIHYKLLVFKGRETRGFQEL